MTRGRSRLDRRHYLGLVGAGMSALAGCQSNSESSGSGDDSEDASGETGGNEERIADLESELGTVEFEGEYFDTHAHWQQAMSIADPLAQRMQQHDIGATVLFSPSANAARDYEQFLTTLTEPDVEYLPFMGAPPPSPDLASSLRSLYDGKEPTFWGIGEWKPQNSQPDFNGDRLSQLWTLAADLDIPVMYHPQEFQEGTVEPALANNPETTFLLHGYQMMGYGQERAGLGPTLPRLLEEYDNLYWQVDVGSMLSGTLVRFQESSQFLDWYASNGDQYISLYQNVLSMLLDAAPNRIVWGTDIAQPWNLESEVFSKLMSFTEQLLEGIPAEHHAAYKYQNALDLFGIDETDG